MISGASDGRRHRRRTASSSGSATPISPGSSSAHGSPAIGIGSGLLAHASNSLVELGYTELLSSFILGNESSMLWHWRNGFELLPYSGSRRQFQAMMRANEAEMKEEAGAHPTS